MFLKGIQSDARNLFMVFYTAFKNCTDLSRKNRRSNIMIQTLNSLTSNNNIILLTSFTIFRQSNCGQIKIKSNSWISNFKKMSGGMSTDNKEVFFPKQTAVLRTDFQYATYLIRKIIEREEVI